jgi:hypothetical protein
LYSALAAIAPQFAESELARQSAINIPSLHFIGMDDLRFKDQSEAWLQTFPPCNRLNLYLPQGHEVPDVRRQVHVDLRGFYERSFSHLEPKVMSEIDEKKDSRLSQNKLRWASTFFQEMATAQDAWSRHSGWIVDTCGNCP